ncbi:MAG: hypothetical protein MJA32_11435, partial [Proteobacteria bacterium]|nr:hypothetical protein [Pseudomonadota bacterium]
HGMARLAWDDRHVFVNGRCRPLPLGGTNLVAAICKNRRFSAAARPAPETRDMLRWMLESGAFEILGNS